MELNVAHEFCNFLNDIRSLPELRDITPRGRNPLAIEHASFVISVVTSVVGLTGNIIVIIITGFVMKTYRSRIWFLNLAIADIMFLLFLPLNSASTSGRNWPFGKHVCRMYCFISIVNLYASIFFITALTVDRVLSVVKPIWHRRISSRTCYSACASIWVVTVSFSVLAIIYSDVSYYREGTACTLFPNGINEFNANSSDINNIRDICQKCLHNNNSIYCNSSYIESKFGEFWKEFQFSTECFLIPLLVFGYFIPLCVILFSNIAIAWRVKISKALRSPKLYCLVTVAIMAFFLTQTPIVIAQILLLVAIQNKNFKLLYKISMLSPLLSSIADINSCLNPVIYVFLGREVIDVFKKFFGVVRQRCALISPTVPVTSNSTATSAC